MQYFHLEQPHDEMILCDRKGCDAIADYLEVEADGTEHRLCAFHNFRHCIPAESGIEQATECLRSALRYALGVQLMMGKWH